MKQINNLHAVAKLTLYVSSYSPLMCLIVVKQISENSKFLNWTGFTLQGFKNWVSKFGLAASLITILLMAAFGCFQLFKNIERNAENGTPVVACNVKNRNSESSGYIATYIIPFLFQDFSDWFEICAIVMILIISYRVYINSTLLLVNPVLNIWYSIYEVEYFEHQKSKNALIISRDKFLSDGAEIKIYEIGYKLFFAKNITINYNDIRRNK